MAKDGLIFRLVYSTKFQLTLLTLQNFCSVPLLRVFPTKYAQFAVRNMYQNEYRASRGYLGVFIDISYK